MIANIVGQMPSLVGRFPLDPGNETGESEPISDSIVCAEWNQMIVLPPLLAGYRQTPLNGDSTKPDTTG
jgi:hypothetical protein